MAYADNLVLLYERSLVFGRRNDVGRVLTNVGKGLEATERQPGDDFLLLAVHGLLDVVVSGGMLHSI